MTFWNYLDGHFLLFQSLEFWMDILIFVALIITFQPLQYLTCLMLSEVLRKTDWLNLTACQPIKWHLMPWGIRIYFSDEKLRKFETFYSRWWRLKNPCDIINIRKFILKMKRVSLKIEYLKLSLFSFDLTIQKPWWRFNIFMFSFLKIWNVQQWQIIPVINKIIF